MKKTQPRLKFEAGRLVNNVSYQADYSRQLRELVLRMTDATEKEITRLFQSRKAKNYFTFDADITSDAKKVTKSLSDKFNDLFARVAPNLSQNVVEQGNKLSQVNLANSLKKAGKNFEVNTKFLTPDIRAVIKAAAADNTTLIKSISQKYLTSVESAVMRSIVGGQGTTTIIKEVQKYSGITQRRAKFIALDQTRKIYSAINVQRLKKLKCNRFKWIHSGGGAHPRPEHVRMNGLIFDVNDPPVIDIKTGQTGFPGQIFNCRCIMVPVFDFEKEEDDE